jgi:GNAT superfamily N-acetyltransferase
VIDCFITPPMRLRPVERAKIADRLCRPGSDFAKDLWSGSYVGGLIAICLDRGEIIGWARTQPWTDSRKATHDTLEAFVAESHRGRGIASYAASGLAASYLREHSLCAVAVFRPSMLLVASRAGLHPTLYDRGDHGWVESWG